MSGIVKGEKVRLKPVVYYGTRLGKKGKITHRHIQEEEKPEIHESLLYFQSYEIP